MRTGIEDETEIEECSDEESYAENNGEQGTKQSCDEDSDVESETEMVVKQADVDDNGMADIWMEMGVGLECSKETVNLPTNGSPLQKIDCDHIFILKDDIGYVCRICGLIQQAIEKIIEYQFKKATRSSTYWHEGRSSNAEPNVINLSKFETTTHDFNDNGIYPHPRHGKQMKPHQVEGFNFLVRNLMTETPGGCILAHAPGSGKTFMLISFLQSFMARHPSARPLVVLPRGIISTWKNEFQRWQVESFPLYDLYSVKAESRSQQLEVLQHWAEKRSILFLGYMQFSSIVCDFNNDEISTECQKILLTCPSILILDEGHTPRNRDTDVLMSLEKVQTPRKVVLSGTLFQNHVEEVFNVLNLVRPKFLKMDSSKAVKRRILSRVGPSKNRHLKNCSDKDFYDAVENTILKDENFARKVSVIQDLRDMTSKVLHYYKGDYLDELPGLMDFAVHLKLSQIQEKEVLELEKLGNKFKKDSEGGVLYVHPQLKNRPRDSRDDDDENIDKILDALDVNDGVKAKFFLNLLQLCESTGEKLLVFSQYLLPLKFLGRLAMRVKNYSVQKEIFMITGDSDSDLRESSMDRFNNSADARVFFGSIKACGEGISLVGASRIIILDVHLNPSVTRQAIGRAFRPGQKRKVYVYRLIAHNSLEVENHKTCFKKESISKLWFEWNEYYGNRDYELEAIDFENCGDMFLESPKLNQDVHSVFRR
ncbi:hypothetical protein Leryth_014087 [Lithospermum erythrorhizon]|nr:hypothetical protein Leryth_014087 [Lithospermum erythrorhizon]